MSQQPVAQQASLFGDASLDHAVAGFGAGTVATLVMHPLDLVKVRFQLADAPSVSTIAPTASSSAGVGAMPNAEAGPSTGTARKPPLGRAVYYALSDAVKTDGWKGLYRGLVPNLVGGASSWGLYFLFYNMIKKDMQSRHPERRTSSSQHLLAAAEASAITAMLTNPIWVVKTRVFGTAKSDAAAYRGLWDGLTSIYRHEGIRGLYKGSLLALVGVSNGSIQFATYEEIKRRRTDIKRRRYEKAGRGWRVEDEKLSNTEYILASGTSKLVAIALTYPYQVVRARIQNAGPAPLGASVPTSATSIASSATPLLPSATSQPRIPSQLYNTPTPTPNTPTSIKPTSPTKISIPAISRAIWRNEGLKGFYKGLGTNALRILPGTCTTFVVYENLVWGFRALALRREGGGVEDLR